jgi:hypothetical protein
MHEAKNSRVGNLDKEAKETFVSQHGSLPDETHIISGVLEADGNDALCSAEAKISSKVLMTERTESGGIRYQIAIFASEPKRAATQPPVAPHIEAAQYLLDEGAAKDADHAADLVKTFGAARVLARKAKNKEEDDKALDRQLDEYLKSAS